ncbi:hypothetical protein [Azonexus sp.]|uniref:hypothetical protein n=1 Tax=Azonexus sp. TaxID=1872668 RepID=UPI0035B3DD3E
MLAPLENRAILERETRPDNTQGNPLLAENLALRHALRQARSSRKRLLTLHATRLAEQDERLKALENERDALRQRLGQFESGQAIVELGQQLMAARAAEQQLMAAIQRVWQLDKTLCAAHRECERLANERDRLARRLCHRPADAGYPAAKQAEPRD